MKNIIFFLASLLLIAGCNNKPHNLKITDLKFADFEKEAIARNKVDTMFMISKNYTLNLGGSDTFGYYEYAKDGNLLFDMQNIFGGHDVTYSYDSAGFVTHKEFSTDYVERSEVTYRFVPDSFLLYQDWAEGIDSNNVLYTCRFKFEKGGRLIEETDYGNNNKNTGERKTICEYNSLGRIIKIKKDFMFSSVELQKYKDLGVAPFNEDVTDFFYSGNILDSTILTAYCQTDPKRNQTTKTYYNSDGLRDKRIIMDSLV